MTARGAASPTVLRFGATLFLSASLLFCVEPMVARMLMPLLGGAANVWITCMLFFQAALLLGYAYAHVSIGWLGLRRQAMVHLVVLLLPFAALPVRVRPESVAALGHAGSPVGSLLFVLVTVVGLPFFVVGATAPLVQRWFAGTDHDGGDDPYFLYGASNFGSLLALAAYPLVIEPWLGLSLQSRLWAWGYGFLVLMLASCAVTAIRHARTSPSRVAPVSASADARPIGVGRRARWVAYAFVPSTLLLGVTSYITTDLAPIPLLWAVPLALYLLTFIFVFARRPVLRHSVMVRILPFGISAVVMMLVVQASTPMLLILAVHLAAFFVASMVCHGELAADRPGAERLTEFFLWVSIGGVLGGVANGLVAPRVFDSFTEYPVALVLAAACRRVAGVPDTPSRRDWIFALGVLAATFGLVALGNRLHLDPTGHVFPLVFAAPLLVTYGQLDRPPRYALGIAATLLGAVSYDASVGRTLHVERSFYGTVKVVRDAAGTFVELAHGTTIHGRQRVGERRDEPTSYYTRTGPLGQVFDELHARTPDVAEPAVAIIGLGAGAMAGYARPTERWTYFEINPSVIRIATDPRYFTFLRDAFGDSSRLRIVLGDARLRLADEPDGSYDLLVIDAFSSDSIPAHLLTREALALYERKLRPRGVVAFHISNRYLDLQPVLASLATDAGLDGYDRRDLVDNTAATVAVGWTASEWIALLPHGEPPRVIASDPRWVRFGPGKRAPWTDDFTDLVRAFRL